MKSLLPSRHNLGSDSGLSSPFCPHVLRRSSLIAHLVWSLSLMQKFFLAPFRDHILFLWLSSKLWKTNEGKYQGPFFEQRFRIKSNTYCLSTIFRGWPTGFTGKAQWYLKKQATGNCWGPSQLVIFFKPDCFFRNAVILPSLSLTANEWIKCLEYWIVTITIRDNNKVQPFYFFIKFFVL